MKDKKTMAVKLSIILQNIKCVALTSASTQTAKSAAGYAER